MGRRPKDRSGGPIATVSVANEDQYLDLLQPLDATSWMADRRNQGWPCPSSLTPRIEPGVDSGQTGRAEPRWPHNNSWRYIGHGENESSHADRAKSRLKPYAKLWPSPQGQRWRRSLIHFGDGGTKREAHAAHPRAASVRDSRHCARFTTQAEHHGSCA